MCYMWGHVMCLASGKGLDEDLIPSATEAGQAGQMMPLLLKQSILSGHEHCDLK